MHNSMERDLSNAIIALESYIIQEEQRLIDKNAGDYEYNYLEPFEFTLRNFKYLEAIYGRPN